MADTNNNNKIINLEGLKYYNDKISAWTVGKVKPDATNYVTVEDSSESQEFGLIYNLGLNLNEVAPDLLTNNAFTTKFNTFATKTDLQNLSLFTIKFYGSFEALPSTGEENVLYVVGDGSKIGESNQLSEYIWDAENLRYELIGTAGIDFTYAENTDIDGFFTTES